MNYTIYNRDGNLYVRFNLGEHNKRIVKSLSLPIGELEIENNKAVGKSKTAILANSKIVRVELALSEGKGIDEAIKEDIDDPIDSETSFVEAMVAAKLAKDTSTYDPVIERYKEYVGEFDVTCEKNNLQTLFNNRERMEVITRMNNHWDGFIDYLADRGLANSSIKTYLATVSAAISHIRRYKGIELPFNASVKVIKTEPYVWPMAAIRQFMEYSEGSWEMDAAKIMIYTCLRPKDAMKLRRHSFKQEGKVFYVEKLNAKNQVVTKAPIPESAWNELKDCSWTGRTLVTFRRHLPDLLERAGIANFAATTYTQKGNKIVSEDTTLANATTPKTLRKVGINWMRDQGVDDTVIRDLYSGNTKQVYDQHYKKINLEKVWKVS